MCGHRTKKYRIKTYKKKKTQGKGQCTAKDWQRQKDMAGLQFIPPTINSKVVAGKVLVYSLCSN